MDKAITEKNYRKIDTKFFNMHFSVIDVASVVVFIVLIMYAAIKLDEAARKLRNEEERIYRERHEK